VRALPDLAPALRACLAGGADFATGAEPQAEGLVLVRGQRRRAGTRMKAAQAAALAGMGCARSRVR
jgi:hypothetical protein